MLKLTSGLRARWRAVAEREAEERRQTPVAIRWHQLNALIAFAQEMGLEWRRKDEKELAEVRRRWVKKRSTLRENADAPVTPSLRDALQAVLCLLQRMDDQGVIIGGIAASLLGRPRLTADIVEAFAEILEVPQLWNDLQRLLTVENHL
ncbi:MAG: hypothetical protein ACK4WK_04935 [Anaerolineae bacterium]